MCGGTGEQLDYFNKFEGLSPRVRGNRNRTAIPGARPGSIPACAGEPHFYCRDAFAARVYPRVCGGTAMAWRQAVS